MEQYDLLPEDIAIQTMLGTLIAYEDTAYIVLDGSKVLMLEAKYSNILSDCDSGAKVTFKALVVAKDKHKLLPLVVKQLITKGVIGCLPDMN